MSNRMDFIYTNDEDEALSLLNGGSVTNASGEVFTMGQEDFVLVPDDTEEKLKDIDNAVAALTEEIPTITVSGIETKSLSISVDADGYLHITTA